MERREWTYKYLRGQGYLIGEAGRGCIATVADEPTVEQIVSEHNEHTALVEQRDLLVGVLRRTLKAIEVIDFSPCREGSYDSIPWQDIEHALATVEQGGEL